MGVHHDNFDMWNSKHTRWNAVNMDPKKDVVGLFRKAALKRGMKFGVRCGDVEGGVGVGYFHYGSL
jgi:alpha-L-fucosidase